MKYRAIHDSNGQIMQANSVGDGVDTAAEAAMYLSRGLYVTELTEAEFPSAIAAVNDDSYYIDVVVTGNIIPRPAAPSGAYEWNWFDHAWQLNMKLINAARKTKMDEVEAIRLQKTVIPVSYASHLWAADAGSVAKINKAYNRMQRTSAKPYGVFGWVTADTPTATLMWSAEPWDVLAGHLSNILNAIEDRDYDLGHIVDLHAEDVYVLDSVEDILAHDVNLYWPF